MPNELSQKNTSQDSPVIGEDIYTMPERFRAGKRVGRKGKKVKIMLMGVGVVIVLGGLIAGALMLFSKSFKEPLKVEDKKVEVVKRVEEEKEEIKKEEIEKEKRKKEEEEIKKKEEEEIKKKEEEEIKKKEEEEIKRLKEEEVLEKPILPSIVDIKEIILPSSLDTDKDGLTNEEEKLFGTNYTYPDTDSDGFLDGQEIENLYSPKGTAPTRLEVSGLVNRYANPVYSYSLLYPSGWLAKALNETNQEVMFISTTGEFTEVMILENFKELTALDWYLAQSPGLDLSQIKTIKVGNLEGIWSLDEMTVYFVSSQGERKFIYVITYNTGIRADVNFRTTFKMMIRSFELPSVQAEEEVPKETPGVTEGISPEEAPPPEVVLPEEIPPEEALLLPH